MNHTRHAGIFNLMGKHATIIGAGGIGAMTALVLAKMGMTMLRVYDDDAVDDVNLATQFHKLSDIGKLKVEALVQTIELFSDDTMVFPLDTRVAEDTDLSDDIVISAVDSITGRQQIWQAVKKSRVSWYLDARMASETFQLYSVNMSSPSVMDAYETALMSLNEEDVPDEVCTSKATFYTASVAAGHIGAAVRRIVMAQPQPLLVVHEIFKNVLTVI